MRISDRAHIVSGVINVIALPLTGVSLFTCGWMKFTLNGVTHSSGLIGYGGSGKCRNMFSSENPSWLQVTLGFMCVAFILQLFSAIYLFLTWVLWRCKRHKMKVDGVIVPLLIMSYLIVLASYGGYATYYFKNNVNAQSSSLYYSYWIALSAGIISSLSIIPLLLGYYHIDEWGDHDTRDKILRL